VDDLDGVVAIGADGTIAGTWREDGANTAFVARTEARVTPIGVDLAPRPTVSDGQVLPDCDPSVPR
jgi:hypothetical protein